MFHPRRDKRKPSCPVTGKIGWASYADAAMARANSESNLTRHYGSKQEKRAYKCPYCKAIHNTSQEKR